MPRERRRVQQKKLEPVEITPGEIYRSIAYTKREFPEAETKLVKKKEPGFVRFCQWCYSTMPSLGKGAKFKQKYKEAIDFLGWRLSAEELTAAIKFTLILSIILGFILVLVAFYLPVGSGEEGSFTLMDVINEFTGVGPLSYFYVFVPVILLVYFLVNFVQKYPLNEAKIEQVRALTYVPEMMGYMIMSMKLVPNLEKAVEFAASHGKGKIAEDFKRILWNVQLGVHNTLSEALDDMAYRWGKFSDEFKTSLMMVRASVLEDTESKRFQLLDKTMENVLESIRNKMEQYARDLSQPTVVLFYLGVLLPLTLIIILPVGSAFTGQAMARPELLILIYNIVIPVTAFVFARNVVRNRPPTYEPPRIPDNSPLIPPKWKMKTGKNLIDLRIAMILVLIIGAVASLHLHNNGIMLEVDTVQEVAIPTPLLVYDCKNPPRGAAQLIKLIPPDKTQECALFDADHPADYFDRRGTLYQQFISRGHSSSDAMELVEAERIQFFMDPKNDITPYNLIFGILITFSLLIFIYFYYSSIYKRKVQLDAMQMESEFKDSLYVLASRLGENKPVEEALRHTREFLPQYKVSTQLFGKTMDNITLLGMPLESAVFDPNYGAMKHNPSAIIRTSMRLLIDSVHMGSEVSARTLISLSLQLNNSEKINKMLKILVKDITSTMKIMCIFVAPVVLGITTALHKIVMKTLAQIISEGTFQNLASIRIPEAATGIGPDITSFTETMSRIQMDEAVFSQIANPAQFTIIVAIYVIELVIILMYFTTKIEEDNNLLAKINIAKALPIAVIVFVASILVANGVIGTFA